MTAADGAILEVRVVLRAGRTELVGLRPKGSGETGGNVLVIRLAAAPVDGAANQALTEFLARLLDLPRRNVAVVGGERSRNKRLRVAGLSPQDLATRLSAVLSR